MEEEEDAHNKKQEQRRLSDFLLESDEELPVGTNSGNKILTEPPAIKNSDLDSGPGFRKLIRLSLFRKKTKRNKGDKEKEEKIEELSQKDSVSSEPKPGNENSLGVGMGIGLFFLLAKTNNEYNKMSELYKELKALLEEMKTEFDNKIFSSTSSDLNSNLVENKCGSNRDKNKMDQMEAEFEIELDRIRQDEQGNEVPNEWIDFCENLGTNLKQNGGNIEDDYGVCPYELEKKLHQLLNQRQEERIKELESQLQNLERKLLEKDIKKKGVEWNC